MRSKRSGTGLRPPAMIVPGSGTVGSVIAWTALSAIVPGAAHLRAGRRRTGTVMLGLYVGVLFTGGLVALSADAELAGKLVRHLDLVIGAAMIGALAWFALILRSYVLLNPDGLRSKGQILSGSFAGFLAVAMMVPFALIAQTAAVSQSTLGELFAAGNVNQDDPWDGRTRVNFLLLGGDWARSRKGEGIRTDSMTVASVDTRTGNTVLFSLPRELENAPFPPGTPLARQFPPPKGFYLPDPADRAQNDLLNAVWLYAVNHPEVAGRSKSRGPDTLKGVIGEILGLDIDYYMLVNMFGLADLIDAIGGVRITVEQDIPYGQGRADGGVVKKGTRQLSGREALWYARARDHDGFTGAGTNEDRMRRQRCVMHALLEQADPATVLAKFNRIASAAKGAFRTDIPKDLLEHLVPLGAKAKNGRISSVQFTKPLIDPAYPNFDKIRTVTTNKIKESERPPSPKPTTSPKPKSSPKTPKKQC